MTLSIWLSDSTYRVLNEHYNPKPCLMIVYEIIMSGIGIISEMGSKSPHFTYSYIRNTAFYFANSKYYFIWMYFCKNKPLSL